MKNKLCKIVAGLALFALLAVQARADETQVLHGHVPAAVVRLNLHPLGRLPEQNVLSLQIGLRLRNPEGFASELTELYNPVSTQYHHWLTPDQIAQNYGPTEQDYQAVIAWVKTNGLTVITTQSDHTLLGVSGTVSDIEKMFHVTLLVYQHPAEARTFYAPDVEPSVDLSVPLWHISGLDNFVIPRPASGSNNPNSPAPLFNNLNHGSGPGGSYVGNDFRNLYVPGVTLNGSGQIVGIYSEQAYYTNDIMNYESFAGLTNIPLVNVVLDELDLLGTNGQPNSGESSLDIEMVASMAPALVEIIVYEGQFTNQLNILKRMQTDNLAKQLTCSYALTGESNEDTIFMMMAAQGQSFLAASGDNGAYSPSNAEPADDPNVTIVGGTMATTSSPGGSWASESAWPNSGGGINQISVPIPSWQQGVSMSLNGGSPTLRNIPDVAMIATGLYSVYGDGITNDNVGGTSAAAPLWAAFTALVNQEAAASGPSSVGFLNPLIYAIGQGPTYSSCFHDITTGNNTTTNSPNEYYATNGYDLVTGWGTPNGQTLIDTLAGFPASVYVDFNYTGATQNGSYSAPFKTLAQGTNAVNPGGVIFIINGGSSPETMTISKPMTIIAVGGAATVGN